MTTRRACTRSGASRRSRARPAAGRTEAWFELNGKYARVLIEWADPAEKAKIIFDLEGDQVIDLYPPEEIDEIAAERHSAD